MHALDSALDAGAGVVPYGELPAKGLGQRGEGATGKPSRRRRSASQWELVSSVNPPTSSSPMATMLDVGIRATYNLGRVERLHGVVHGGVQGVGFRYFLMAEARRLGLKGWVRNRDDGTVEFVAEGTKPHLERLKQAAGHGPRMARVERVDAQWSAAAGDLDSFDLT